MDFFFVDLWEINYLGIVLFINLFKSHMLMTIVMNYVVSKLWNSLHSKLYLNDFDNYYYIFDNDFYEETVHA